MKKFSKQCVSVLPTRGSAAAEKFRCQFCYQTVAEYFSTTSFFSTKGARGRSEFQIPSGKANACNGSITP